MPKKKKSVYIVGNDNSMASMFRRNDWDVVDRMRYADLVQFTGGTDINPILYGAAAHQKTSPMDPWRDKLEGTIFNLCLKEKKHMAGVCRGMQLINALVGGSMWQDVDHHFGEHPVTCDFYNFSYKSNSIHHQMIIPSNRAYVMAFSKCATVKERIDSNGQLHKYKPLPGNRIDPEVVYWEHANAFGVQWHPEYQCHANPDLDELYISYLNDVLLDD